MTAVDLAASWATTIGYADRAAHRFWCTLDDRLTGLLPEAEAPLFFAGLGRLASGGDDATGRAALLAVLARAHRRYQLLPWHHAPIADALLAAVAHHHRSLWTDALTAGWERATHHALRAIESAAARTTPGPAWWPAEVVDHDRPAPGVAILTVRPWHRLPHQSGQAVPVSTPRQPGRWRWYSPANAPRPDGTIELHVRAVAAGTVSPTLVHRVRPGEQLWLGPAHPTGLTLNPPPPPLDRPCLPPPLDRSGRSPSPDRPGLPDVPSPDLLLVAGGTGLAPLRALVEQVAAAPDGRRVTLIVGARTLEDLYDPVALDKLQTAHPWLTVVPAFSHDPYAEPAEQGNALTFALYHHRPGQHVHVCGPPAMLTAARARLLAAGIPADHLHLPHTPGT